MYLIFTDESGNTGRNLLDPEQPFHYICGIYVRYGSCLALQDSIEQIAKGLYDPLPQDFEFKGSAIYSGKKHFKSFSPAKRIKVADDLIDLLDKHDLKYIISIIDKKAHHYRYTTPFHPQNLATLYFLEMFQHLLDQEGKLGLVVSDEEDAQGDEIIKDFKKYRQQGTGFCTYKSVELSRIIDNIHYVDSKNSWPLQLSDVILYYINKGRRMLISKGMLYIDNPDMSKFSRSEKVLYDQYVRIVKHLNRWKQFP